METLNRNVLNRVAESHDVG